MTRAAEYLARHRQLVEKAELRLAVAIGCAVGAVSAYHKIWFAVLVVVALLLDALVPWLQAKAIERRLRRLYPSGGGE